MILWAMMTLFCLCRAMIFRTIPTAHHHAALITSSSLSMLRHNRKDHKQMISSSHNFPVSSNIRMFVAFHRTYISFPSTKLRFNHYHNNAAADDLVKSCSSSSTVLCIHQPMQQQQHQDISKREKEQSRKLSRLELHTRHLQTKALLTSLSNNNNNPTNILQNNYNLIAIQVSVDTTLRLELKLNGREKRGRIFVTPSSEACTTLPGLKQELHAFFRCLKRSTYTIHASLPLLHHHQQEEEEQQQPFWEITTDQHVMETFQKAQEFFNSYHTKNNNNNDIQYKTSSSTPLQDVSSPLLLKRPTILLRIEKDIHASLPQVTIPHYLENMANPTLTDTMTMLSFYSFPPRGIQDPEELASTLKKLWKPFHVLGRVYVAQEGMNAQMAIPSNILDNFKASCHTIPELSSYMENGLNIDPIPLTMDEFAVAGDMNGKPQPPFKTLHIRVRNQVVADGLDKPLNWQSAGYDMPPLEWHERLKSIVQPSQEKLFVPMEDTSKSQDTPQPPTPIILDCRNKYESNVGRFVGAEPLDTDNFRDTWNVLKERLKDTAKDVPIMTYCTGGIRCVKVGAYLTQEMGFTNVSRLAGGIVSYDRAIHSLEETSGKVKSMFMGTNYVFDGRVGRQITNDALAECITCGNRTSLVSNCNNENCHKRMTQCQTCRSSFSGTCSDACKIRVLNQGLRPVSGIDDRTFFSTQKVISKKYQSLDEYSAAHSSSPPTIYDEILENTKAYFPSGAHMASGAQQGRLLTSLASMTREGRILELGTFTAYATACFLEGAANVAAILNNTYNGDSQMGPFVLSLERDRRAFTLAANHLQAISQNKGASELSRIRETQLEDLEVDSMTYKYKNACCQIVRVNDALAYVEALSMEDSPSMFSPFDLIFIDADKTRLLEYMEVFLTNDKILKKGGMILVDNVLWKGGVLGEQVDHPVGIDEDIDSSGKTDAEMKRSRRARKLANVMHHFNTNIVNDKRVEVVILPLRDGLSVIRKKI